jgi:hypothetical protein
MAWRSDTRREAPLTFWRKLIVSRDPAWRRMGGVEVWPWRAFVGALWSGEIACD